MTNITISYTIDPKSLRNIRDYHIIESYNGSRSDEERKAYRDIADILDTPNYINHPSARATRLQNAASNSSYSEAVQNIYKQAIILCRYAK